MIDLMIFGVGLGPFCQTKQRYQLLFKIWNIFIGIKARKAIFFLSIGKLYQIKKGSNA